MRHCANLAWLTLSIEEGTEAAIVSFIANLCALVPEVLRVTLIGYIVQHAGDLSSFNFVKHLSSKLEVVTLLVN